MAGSFLQIAADNRLETARVPFSFDVPIWDAYTQSVSVASGPDRENKRILKAAIKAAIVNLGKSPFPGQIEGSFNVRPSLDGPRLLVASGRSLEGSSDIARGRTKCAQLIKGKTFVKSSIFLLCPDGSYGSLADGNIENNTRVLQGNG